MGHAARRISIEHEVDSLLASVDSHDQLLDELVGVIGSSLGWDTGAHWVIDQGNVLRARTIWHRDDSPSPTYLRATIADRVLESKRPRWSCETFENGVQTALAFPVLTDDHVLGVVELLTRAKLPEDPELLETIGSIGYRAGAAECRLRS